MSIILFKKLEFIVIKRKINGVENNFRFSVTSVIKEKPFTFIFLSLILSILIIGC
jgi:hypothetical protein